MKKLIPILLLITIIVSCIFAFTACSKDGLYLLDEWEYETSDAYSNTYIKKKYVLEFIAKATCSIPKTQVDGEHVSINLSPYNIEYINRPSGTFCAGDKIRFDIDCLPTSKLKRVEITVEYLNGKSETLVYKF